jgi:hypothetical protein
MLEETLSIPEESRIALKIAGWLAGTIKLPFRKLN